MYSYTTQRQVRQAFWDEHPQYKAEARERGTLSKGQNAQSTDTRLAFCDYVDALCANGEISEALAERVTL